MTSNKTRTALVLATVLIGLSGCAGGGGTQASAPATTAGTSPSMSMEPSAPAGSTASGPGSGAANAAAAAITISNFAYEIPGAVAPGAEVKVTASTCRPVIRSTSRRTGAGSAGGAQR